MADHHRSIRERWIIEGTLLLETPAHFGNGDTDALTDMPLLFDEISNDPLLPGTSIAGALRNYLREFQNDYEGKFPNKGDEVEIKEKEQELLATKLFGGYRGDDDGEQSPLIVYDALGKSAGFELRDGVKIDSDTRTAKDKKKFDIQLLSAGTTFDLRFELIIYEFQKSKDITAANELKQALAIALSGLVNREITLGARKRRGFGQVTAANWRVKRYDLRDKDDLLAWLTSESQREKDGKTTVWESDQKTIAELLNVSLPSKKEDHRSIARLIAKFNVEGTLLIRSGFGDSDKGPDTVHIHARRKDKNPDPVIPGTSWAGVLRHRALKITRTVSNNENLASKKDETRSKSEIFIDQIFGPSLIKKGDKNTKASRIDIKESEIETNADSLVVTRVKIDRFTGGAYDGALFNEQPIIGKPDIDQKHGTRLTLDLCLRKPSEAQIGLLLLLLKDLWVGDLPIGGETGIGRGRLLGKYAKLEFNNHTWEFIATNEENGVKLTSSKDAPPVQNFVDDFNKIENWMV